MDRRRGIIEVSSQDDRHSFLFFSCHGAPIRIVELVGLEPLVPFFSDGRDVLFLCSAELFGLLSFVVSFRAGPGRGSAPFCIDLFGLSFKVCPSFLSPCLEFAPDAPDDMGVILSGSVGGYCHGGRREERVESS